MIRILTISFLFVLLSAFSVPSYKLGRLKYNGGGDWYSSRTALTNLAKFCNQHLETNFHTEEGVVEAGSSELFNYPYVFATGHGNIMFSEQEARNLRTYLSGGGFLHLCDNYGFDKFIRPQMKKVFPELEFIELPFSHPVYHQKYNFPNGLPKIHEHEGKRSQGFGLIYEGRLVCFYDFESDLGNGWEDLGTYPEDSPETHEKALRMGANLIQYALTN